jgi:hypothetical protein
MGVPTQAAPRTPLVFLLHCGLDVNRVRKSCQRLGQTLSISCFRREEIFAYHMRLDRPRPDLIIIRSHFRSLVRSLNREKRIPAIVVSSHQQPADCCYPFIMADSGYQGLDALPVYRQIATAIVRELHPAGPADIRPSDAPG